MSRKVLIAAPVHTMLIEGLTSAGYECIVREHIKQEEGPVLIQDCVGVITSTRLHLDKALLDAAPGLQWIGRMGSGMEVIDVPYAQSKGIACYSSPDGNCNAVAEHAVGLLLSLTKRIAESSRQVIGGAWLREENRGTELEGKTIGIIGFGHTGRAFAKKLQGFDMQILAYDKYNGHNFPPYVQPCISLNEIYDRSDIISFHVPLQEDTTYYFNSHFIEKMQHPFILLNTSRGMVVDTAALLAGLQQNKVLAAGLDVLEKEPLERVTDDLKQGVDHMLKMPNVIITPHIAGYSFEAMYKMSASLLRQIVTR
jgi:D-3-phosphoglycerate dehydrogenase